MLDGPILSPDNAIIIGKLVAGLESAHAALVELRKDVKDQSISTTQMEIRLSDALDKIETLRIAVKEGTDHRPSLITSIDHISQEMLSIKEDICLIRKQLELTIKNKSQKEAEEAKGKWELKKIIIAGLISAIPGIIALIL